MLDEIREAYEYMYDFDNDGDKPRRINVSSFIRKNEMNGVERILTIISRYFIFDGELNTDISRDRAEVAMRMWLGLTDELDEKKHFSKQYENMKKNYPQLDHWLEKYLKLEFDSIDNEKKERINSFLDSLQIKKKYLKTKSMNKKTNTNDFKQIRYDKIMANAQVARGPLKRYYLVCADPDWKRGIYKETEKNPSASIDKHEGKILKLVAAYLIEKNRKKKSNNDYVHEYVNYKELSYWADTKLDGTKYKEFSYEDSQTHVRRPLFSSYSALSGNLSKIRPDEEWLEYCGWEIIEATESDDKLDEYLSNNPNAIFFSDYGVGKTLSKNVRYKR